MGPKSESETRPKTPGADQRESQSGEIKDGDRGVRSFDAKRFRCEGDLDETPACSSSARRYQTWLGPSPGPDQIGERTAPSASPPRGRRSGIEASI